ncbi:glycoside hydrolase family 3 protein [Petrocella sp. FN5]|uniref:glycoside hydrolase family 3 protein n=1 Tax=Petrocella sp. FN5 TaxID=3032002 RepID=UPI0023D9F688|nr:glycoside hydrolase family 3 protein [Petrocella sp. FN5]MDF1618283.1 glycoside hydrolase family 3 protein [Petrocella sp. FN5]
MIKYTWILILLLLLSGCQTGEEKLNQQEKKVKENIQQPTPSVVELEDKREKKSEEETVSEDLDEATLLEMSIDEIMSNMSLEAKVAQMFYVTLEDYESTGLSYGGIIFFKHNMITAIETQNIIRKIQSELDIPAFIGLDEEGGLVTRITGEASIGGTKIPDAWVLGHATNPNAVYLANEIIAKEIRSLGFNMNFAPVGDIHTNPSNPIIGHRAFSDNPHIVGEKVIEALKAYQEHEIIPVIKHYPGHGDTKEDSHLGTAILSHDIERLMSVELVPFIEAIRDGVDVIMVGHLQVPQVTGDTTPASLSEMMIQEILIRELGFKGLVISDALNMKSIVDYYGTELMIDLGLDAGLSLFLMPEDVDNAYEYLLKKARTSIETEIKIEEAVRKIIRLKLEKNLFEYKNQVLQDPIIGQIEDRNIIAELEIE